MSDKYDLTVEWLVAQGYSRHQARKDAPYVMALADWFIESDRRIAAMTPEERAELVAAVNRGQDEFAGMLRRLGREPRYIRELQPQ